MSMDAQLNHAASEAAQESKPPRVPIERHVVACVQELERIRANVDQALFVMRHGQFDDPALWLHTGNIALHADELMRSYNAYHEVRNCEGQA